jgi:hypothetical protein
VFLRHFRPPGATHAGLVCHSGNTTPLKSTGVLTPRTCTIDHARKIAPAVLTYGTLAPTTLVCHTPLFVEYCIKAQACSRHRSCQPLLQRLQQPPAVPSVARRNRAEPQQISTPSAPRSRVAVSKMHHSLLHAPTFIHSASSCNGRYPFCWRKEIFQDFDSQETLNITKTNCLVSINVRSQRLPSSTVNTPHCNAGNRESCSSSDQA